MRFCFFLEFMANLFFIHTPFQLFVAQQIIAQEKITNNIMCYGCVGNNTSFFKIYNAIIIPDFWKQKIYIDNIEGWSLFRFSNPFKGVISTIKTKIKIERVMKKENVKQIFLGDIWNKCYQLISLYYYNKGYKICFFEEGSSHYININSSVMYDNICSRLIRAVLSDLFFYFPIWKMCFSKRAYLKPLQYDDLKISTRFSIRPKYNEKYDKRLYIRNIVSNNVQDIINSSLAQIVENNNILFLSEPLDINSPNCMKVEIEALRDYLLQVVGIGTILVKFHPRENEIKKASVLSVFKELSLPYCVICEEINIPVEYFLMRIKFNKILTYFCSTVFYNGYIFPQTEIISLLPKCEDVARNLNDNLIIESLGELLNSNMYSELFNHK